jgi:branched-chain amino acid transport system permease protein
VQTGLKAFVAAVLGGIGNLPGAALGGLIIGLLETFVGGIPGLSNYRDGIAFAILILILIVKPAGLLGKSTVEKV